MLGSSSVCHAVDRLGSEDRSNTDWRWAKPFPSRFQEPGHCRSAANALSGAVSQLARCAWSSRSSGKRSAQPLVGQDQDFTQACQHYLSPILLSRRVDRPLRPLHITSTPIQQRQSDRAIERQREASVAVCSLQFAVCSQAHSRCLVAGAGKRLLEHSVSCRPRFHASTLLRSHLPTRIRSKSALTRPAVSLPFIPVATREIRTLL